MFALNMKKAVTLSEKISGTPALLHAAVGLTLCAFFCNLLARTVADPDLWGYLAFGKLFWEADRFPYQDIFTYLPTLPQWIYHEWLTGVIFYPLYEFLGAPGLQLLKYLLALGTAGFLYLTARGQGAGPVVAALALFLASGFFAVGYSPVRAQVFTYFFFAVTLYLLEQTRQTGRWRALWLLPPLLILWCNLHGGFPAGLGLIGFYAVGEAVSRRPFLPYLGILFLSALATLINPYGPEYWHYVIRAVTMPRPYINEWVSISENYRRDAIEGLELVYYGGFGILLAFSLGMSHLRSRWRELTTPLLALLLTLVMGWRHIRHIVFFLMLFAAFLPNLLAPYIEELKARTGFMAVLRTGAKVLPLLLAVLLSVQGYGLLQKEPLKLTIPPVPASEHALAGSFYPVGALEYIQGHEISGKILTEFGWGEYLIWVLHPRCQVGLDGRYETVYTDRICEDYFNFLLNPRENQQFLRDHPPDMVLVRTAGPVHSFLLEEPGWHLVYTDASGSLFVPSISLSER